MQAILIPKTVGIAKRSAPSTKSESFVYYDSSDDNDVYCTNSLETQHQVLILVVCLEISVKMMMLYIADK